jgi:hypothetical protein
MISRVAGVSSTGDGEDPAYGIASRFVKGRVAAQLPSYSDVRSTA